MNELDQFVKHELRAKYYIRYVDDFTILDNNKEILLEYKDKINEFLKTIKLELHPDKSKIVQLNSGVSLLGFRVFYNYKLPNKRNLRKIKHNLLRFKNKFYDNQLDYDKIYSSFEGWIAYSKHANTYKLRKRFIQIYEEIFSNQISSIEVNRLLKNYKLISAICFCK